MIYQTRIHVTRPLVLSLFIFLSLFLSPQQPHIHSDQNNNLCVFVSLPLPFLCWFLSFFSSCLRLQTHLCASSPPLSSPSPPLIVYLFSFSRRPSTFVLSVVCVCVCVCVWWCVYVWMTVCMWYVCVCLWPTQRPDQLHRHVSDAKTHVSAARPREEVSRPGRL